MVHCHAVHLPLHCRRTADLVHHVWHRSAGESSGRSSSTPCPRTRGIGQGHTQCTIYPRRGPCAFSRRTADTPLWRRARTWGTGTSPLSLPHLPHRYLLSVLYLEHCARARPASPSTSSRDSALRGHRDDGAKLGGGATRATTVIQYHDLMGALVAPWAGKASRVMTGVALFGLSTVH